MYFLCCSAAKEDDEEESSEEESEEEAAAPANKNGKAAAAAEESSEEEDDDEDETSKSKPGTQDFLSDDTSFKSRNNSFNNQSNGSGSFRIFVGYLSAAPDHNALMTHLGVDENELQDMHIMGKNFDEPPRPKGYCHMEVADEATFKVIMLL